MPRLMLGSSRPSCHGTAEASLTCPPSHDVQAIRARPSSWSYWSDLGWCYHAEGKQAAALKAYGRAEELLEQHALRGGGGDDGVQNAARVRVKSQVLRLPTQRRLLAAFDDGNSFGTTCPLRPLIGGQGFGDRVEEAGGFGGGFESRTRLTDEQHLESVKRIERSASVDSRSCVRALRCKAEGFMRTSLFV